MYSNTAVLIEPQRHFNNIDCTFWSSDNEMTKACEYKTMFLNSLIKNSSDDESIEKFKQQKDNIIRSEKILLNQSVSNILN